MLHVKDLHVSFGSNEVLKGISLDVNAGEAVVLAGANGSGKSTLLACIASRLKPDSGSITISADAGVALLEQEVLLEDVTAAGFLMSSIPALSVLYRRLAETPSGSGDYSQALGAFTDAGGFRTLADFTRAAGDLGFVERDLERPLATFSPGERQMFSIIRLHASPARLVLMDEPLNHLDIAMRVHVEEFVLREKRRGRGFLIVTHDRVFADRVADRTIYIRRGEGITVKGGYSEMVSHLELDFESRQKRAHVIARKIKTLEDEVRRRKAWADSKERTKTGSGPCDRGFISAQAARMAKRAKSAQKREERHIEELKETKPFVEKRITLSMDSYPVANRIVAKTSGISKSFDCNLVFSGVDLMLSTRDRVALIGPNGSGKTTLIRSLVGEEVPDRGSVQLSEHVRVFYLPQDIGKFFKRSILLENLLCEGVSETAVREQLGRALLRGDKPLEQVSALSRGELMRAAVVRAVIERAEFLFLDEPTNHLDIESLSVLDRLVEEFPGGMLFTSHDRYFIARHSTQVLSIQNKTLVPITLA